MTYPFNNKEEYLAYRKMWKAEYKELTRTIRDAKRCKLLFQQATSKANRDSHVPGKFRSYAKFYNLTKENLENDVEYQELKKKYNTSNYQYWMYPDREKLRGVATQMLEDLKGAKIEAQRQYLEQENLVLS